MNSALVVVLAAFLTLSSGEYIPKNRFAQLVETNFTDCFSSTDGDSVYDYSTPALDKTLPDIKFKDYKGKIVLIVNVATYCRSTVEYPALNKLQKDFGKDLVIIAFPCDQFLNQEPGSNVTEIMNGIKYVRPGNGFVPLFKFAQKTIVNGPQTTPLYSFLKRSCPATRKIILPNTYLIYDGKNTRDIRWNFEKFLIHPQTGKPVHRYDETFGPLGIVPHIKELQKYVK